jgi:hypothetical protein
VLIGKDGMSDNVSFITVDSLDYEQINYTEKLLILTFFRQDRNWGLLLVNTEVTLFQTGIQSLVDSTNVVLQSTKQPPHLYTLSQRACSIY